LPEPEIPDAIGQLAEARRDARAARGFDEADRLKAEIEAAGWRVTDIGAGYRLDPAHPADLVVGGRTRHGWSGSIPSRLAEQATAAASIVLVATNRPDDVERALAGLAGAVGDDVQRIVVANAPSAEQEALLVEWEARFAAERATGPGAEAVPAAEIVWTADRFGVAAALNAGIRRATGGVVILLDGTVEPIGDFVGPLVRALGDARVAVAGPWGLLSDDQRHYEAAAGGAAAGGAGVAAIDLAAMAFRRADYRDRGPLDESFMAPVLLDAWWSLVLRDEGGERAPRRAVIVDVPLVRHERAPRLGARAAEDAKTERRYRYRLIDRFGERRDLAVRGGSPDR